MGSRVIAALATVSLGWLTACGPGKSPGETDGGSSSSTSAGTATVAASTSGEPTASTTGEPTSSTTGEPTSSTTGEPTTGSSSTGGTSSGLPPHPCEQHKTEEDCLATQSGGHDDCAWQPEFARWSEGAGCGEFAGPPRCIAVRYVGDGCLISDCPPFELLYFRELEGGVVELTHGGTCGLEPEGWQQCAGFGDEHPACACFC